MKIYQYLASTVIRSTLLVLLVLGSLIFFSNMIGELSYVGRGHYTILSALQYVSLTLPQVLYQIFPTIMLIGTLVGLGSLATHSELTVMRTSGLSLLKIASAVLAAGMLLIVIAGVVGENQALKWAHVATVNKQNAMTGSRMVDTIRNGVWLKQGDDFYQIHKVLTADQVFGVTRFQFNHQYHLVSSSYAESGTRKGNKWMFHNVVISTMPQGHAKLLARPNPTALNAEQQQQMQVSSAKQSFANWPFKFDLRQFAVINPQFMSLPLLLADAKIKTLDQSSRQRLLLAFWQRILQPITTMIMILLAIPFIFGPLRSVSIGLRLMSGVLVGLCFYILNNFFSQVGLVYQLPPYLAASMLPSLFLGFAVFLFKWKR